MSRRVYEVMIEAKESGMWIKNYSSITVTANSLEEAVKKAGKFKYRNARHTMHTRPQEAKIITELS